MRGDRFNNGINFGSLRDCYTGERRIHKRRHVRALRHHNRKVIDQEINNLSAPRVTVLHMDLHGKPEVWTHPVGKNRKNLSDLIWEKLNPGKTLPLYLHTLS